jgi:hypothetical protein
VVVGISEYYARNGTVGSVRRFGLIFLVAFLSGISVLFALAPKTSERPATNKPPATSGAPQVGVFDDTGSPQFDVRLELQRISEESGPKVAIETLYSWAEDFKQFAMVCHNDAHMLGSIAARSADPVEVASYATTRCDNGYIHGILKSVALDAPQDFNPSTLRSICAKAPADVREGCEHGIGHAIVVRGSMSLTDGLKACLKLGSDKVIAQCVTGVAMEFGVNNMIFHDLRSMDPGSLDKGGNLKQLPLTPDELLDPCAPLRGSTIEGLDICYRHVHYFWSTELGRDYQTFAERCRVLIDDPMGSCYQSMGAWVWQEEEIYADSPVPDHQKVLDRSCMTLKWDDAVSGCLHGYMHTIWQAEQRKLPSLCAALGPRYEPGCSLGEAKFLKN